MRDPSIEFPDEVCLITIRTIASRLWFVNNPTLEHKILAHLAKYQEIYNVKIFAFILMGNHYHLLARFPDSNRHQFLNAFDAIIPKLVSRYVESFIDGKLWARRARSQVVPNPEDVERQFFYTALNPISSGLTPRMSGFSGYSCVQDSINGQSNPFKLVNWSAYNNAKRHNPKAREKDYEEQYRINYSRLPGREDLSRKEYGRLIQERLTDRHQEMVQERLKLEKGFAGAEALKKTVPGALPFSTKTSERHTPRPLVITACRETKRLFLEMYFGIVNLYKRASLAFRSGDFKVYFPPGTHRPRVFVPTG